MPTRTELRDLIRGQTLVESDDYTDAKVNNLINAAIRDISVRFPWPYLAKTSTMSVTASVESVALPSDCDRIASINLEGGSKPLYEIAPSTAFQSGDSAGSGTPTAYFLWGENVMLRPVPDANSTLNIYYYREPVELSSDGATPEFAPQFHLIVADYVMQMLWEREEDFQKAATFNQRYLQGIELMARFYLNRADDAPLVIGQPQGGRSRGPRMPWLEV
jgi:hypothetical protein